MSERNHGLLVIVIPSLIGMGMAAPARARDGVNTFGVAGCASGFVVHAPRRFTRNSIVTPHITARNADLRTISVSAVTLGYRTACRSYGRIRHSPMRRQRTFFRVRAKSSQAHRLLQCLVCQMARQISRSQKLHLITVISLDAARSRMATTVTPRTTGRQRHQEGRRKWRRMPRRLPAR
jgi:hypothetical protein